MKRLFLFLFVVFPLLAVEPNITNTRAVKTDRTVTVVWDSDQTGPARLGFDFQGDNIDWTTSQTQSGAAAGQRSQRIHSAIPGNDIYLIPQSRDSGSTWSTDFTCPSLTCTNCGSADDSFFADNSGLDCSPGNYPKLTTLATDPVCASPPCEPQAPTNDGLTACPTVTGTSRTVLGDGSDFLEQFNDAKSDAGTLGTVEEILIPAGVAIRPEDQTGAPDDFVLTNIANDGWVVIRSDADAKLLPPAGTMTDPSYFPHMGRFEMNPEPLDWDNGVGNIFHFSGDPRGYCFENVIFTTPPVSTLPKYTFNITAYDVSTDTFTTDGDLSQLQNGSIIFLSPSSNLTGGGFGVRKICNISGSDFKVSGLNETGYACQGTSNLTGSNCSTNCGSFVHWTALEIESISNTTPVELTITGHGFPQFPVNTIDGTTGSDNVTATSTLGGMDGNAVYVNGTGVSTCDGPWVGSVSGSTITLSSPVNDSVTPDCTSVSSGTIERVYSISVMGTSDPDLGAETPKQFAIYPSDADTLVLLQSQAQGSVTGGFIFSETQALSQFFRLGNGGVSQNVKDFVWDRVAMVYPFPWNAGGLINWSRSQDVSIVNSWLENTGKWQRRNPVSGGVESLAVAGGDISDATLYPQGSDDVQIINNMLLWSPMIYTETPSNSPVTNYRVNQNVLFTADRYVENHENFEYLAMGQTFAMEFKDFDTGEIVGNYFKGARSHRNNSQAAVEFSGIGSTTSTLFYTRDVRLAYNTVTDSAAGFHVTSDGSLGSRIHGPVQRILVEHNLFVELDSLRYNGTGAFAGGRMVFALGGFTDFIVRRNTYWAWKVHNPLFLQFGSGSWSQGALFNDNLVLATEGSFDSIGVKQYISSSMIPTPTTEPGSAGIAEYFLQGDSADASTDFSSNTIIPGVENSPGGYVSKYSSTDDADTISVNDASGRAELDMSGNTFVGNASVCSGGTCPDSLQDRQALALIQGSYRPAPTYDADGADLAELEDQQGWVQGIDVSGNSNQLTIEFGAPSTTGCYVQLATFNTDWMTTFDSGNLANISNWTQATGGSKNQSVTFSSLSAGTKHYYRIGCTKSAIGEATTAP